jgi:(p)ppGpp synthase/HD superfamily hydrolase
VNKIIEAARFAREAHHGQLRKYSTDPYIVHPMRVAGRVSMYSDATEEMVVASWLHDVVEDTHVGIVEVSRRFGGIVASLVGVLTNGPYEPGMNRKARKELDREKLSGAPWEAKIIKMYDRIDNLRDLGGAESDFKLLYYSESIALADTIGDADLILKGELVQAAGDLIGLTKA